MPPGSARHSPECAQEGGRRTEGNLYVDLLFDLVQDLSASIGAGRTLKALGIAHRLAPAEGITEYDSQVRLADFLEIQKGQPDYHLRDVVSLSLDKGEQYVARYRDELLRQSRIAFNAMLVVVLVGAAAIVGGVVLLFEGRITAGALSSAAGVLVSVAIVPLSKLNRETNKRLDKIAAGIDKLKSLRARFDRLEQGEVEGRGRKR